MSLSGRVAFVTGASQGIGRACALKLATEGATVAAAARNQDKLNELVNEIIATGGRAAGQSASHNPARPAANLMRGDFTSETPAIYREEPRGQ